MEAILKVLTFGDGIKEKKDRVFEMFAKEKQNHKFKKENKKWKHGLSIYYLTIGVLGY